MNEEKNSPGDGKTSESKSPLALGLSLLGSLKFALLIVILIAVACIIGTLLPQGSQVAKYIEQNPDAKARMDLLTAMGLTHVFSASWFTMLLVALAASLSVCTTRRAKAALRTKGVVRGRIIGSVITHVSMLLILGGGVIRGVWGQKGYLELREGQTATHFSTESGNQALPFAVHLTNFEIELYEEPEQDGMDGSGSRLIVQWPEKQLATSFPVELDVEHVWPSGGAVSGDDETYRIKIVRYVPDFVIDISTREVTNRSNEPRNPAIQVSVISSQNHTNNHWLFANFPNFNMHTTASSNSVPDKLQLGFESGAVAAMQRSQPQIKDYKSYVEVVENGKVVLEKMIEVNAPLSYKGYNFFQLSYDPNDLTYTLLQVVSDPGIPVVYTGFLLMILGLTIVFYLCPWLKARGEKTGETS